jgi:hypothetical protein
MPNDGYGTKVERLAHDDHLTTRQSEIVGVGPLTRTPTRQVPRTWARSGQPPAWGARAAVQR